MGVFLDWLSGSLAAEVVAARGGDVPYLATLAAAFPDGELGELAVGAGRCACFRWRVGKFTCTTHQQAMASDEVIAEAVGKVRTLLTIDFPTVEGLSFEIRKDTWDVEPNGLLEEFLFGISARFSSDDLKAFMHERDFLGQVHGLLSQRLGEISCDARRFRVIVDARLDSQSEALSFVGNAIRVFQRFAKLAHLTTPAWRAPTVGHDWWQPLDLPRDDAAPPEDLSSARIDAYLRRNYALPGQGRDRATGDNGSMKFDPKAFVLCSSCLAELDETRVDCPTCGAGHHWTCAVGRCGECGGPLERPAQSPALPLETRASEGAAGGAAEVGILPAGADAAGHAPARGGALPAAPALPPHDGEPAAFERQRDLLKLD